MQLKGKRGVPSYKDKGRNHRIDVNESGMSITGQEGSLFRIDKEEKEFSVSGYKQPYIPVAVYKTIVKMALSIVDRKYLTGLRDAVDWLLESDHSASKVVISPLMAYMWTIPGPLPVPHPKVLVFERKHNALVPYMQIVVCFGNLQFQVVVPGFRMDACIRGVQIDFHRFPPPVSKSWEYGEPKMIDVDLSSKELKRNEPVRFTFSYEEREQDSIIEESDDFAV